ncbi:hypothetical protein FA95DRAFT_1613547 [Auriscalpium vulgare]|uniref:Uncharacterized protein n=1 Tax=Auriscalpium vulgare TaxID=40419 RepID=A0ACB8R298_9AGAM|nr:hypothetical protein FA95DRAFT_1613547 [Auriscalpium vulgare]
MRPAPPRPLAVAHGRSSPSNKVPPESYWHVTGPRCILLRAQRLLTTDVLLPTGALVSEAANCTQEAGDSVDPLEQNCDPVKVLGLTDVAQVDVLDDRLKLIRSDTLYTQGLLEPRDESLELARRRGYNMRPKHMAIYPIESENPLCHDAFAFYIT